jgi:hypothetical protein
LALDLAEEIGGEELRDEVKRHKLELYSTKYMRSVITSL